jgi:hypothetical protein
MNLIIVFLDIKKHNILQIRIEGNKTLIKESMTNIKNQKTKRTKAQIQKVKKINLQFF